ncbi:MAG: hypothetical protein GY778_08920 [bacterium]|nr:hypothetical protein [bacterium]
MSQIPSDIAGSALQAGFQSRQVGKQRDGERAGQAQAANNTARAVDEAGSTVETTDNDSQVYADAEGAGSQGRSYDEELLGEDALENGATDEAGDVITDVDGQLHLDLEA